MMRFKQFAASAMAALMLAASCALPASAADGASGDVDCSGSVNIADAVMLARFCAEDQGSGITAEGKRNADLNGDGDVTSEDISVLLRQLANLPAEADNTVTNDLLAGRTLGNAAGIAADDSFRTAQDGFTMDLLRACQSRENVQKKSGGNVLVSPLSVSLALAMTANGAKGQTRSEMETLLGGDMTIDRLNEYYAGWEKGLSAAEIEQLWTANSVWVRDNEKMIHVPDAFLDDVTDYYSAGIYTAPFDGQTVDDINAWVNTNTHEMIPEVIDELSDDAVMVLINALAFEADWKYRYWTEDEIQKWDFTNADGSVTEGELMCSTEDIWLHDDKATGFVKPYEGGKYAFAAVLPNEGITLDEYLEGLDGEALNRLLTTAEEREVWAKLPKFSFDFSDTLAGTLSEMGMPTAFIPGTADFTGLNDAPGMDTWIGNVIHKTFIDVAEQGTKAAAVTAVIMEATSCVPPEDQELPKQVYLTRPFLFMIVDQETDLPVFIGTVNSLADALPKDAQS